MNYTLTDPNGNVLLAVESTPVVTEADMKADLDKAAKACESAFDEVTKYQDAMAVMSSEGFGEQVKAVADKAWKKIKEFFINIGKWIKHVVDIIKQKFVAIGNKINGKSITAALQTIKNKHDAQKKTTTESKTTSADKRNAADVLIRFGAVCDCFDDHLVDPDKIVELISEVEDCDNFGELSRLLVKLNNYADEIKTKVNGTFDGKYDVILDHPNFDLDVYIDECISSVKKNGIESILKNCKDYINDLNNAMENLTKLSNTMIKLSNAELVQQNRNGLGDDPNYVADTEAIKLANLKCNATNMCRSCVDGLISIYDRLISYANRVFDIIYQC